jgi:serine/threonine protein kinase
MSTKVSRVGNYQLDREIGQGGSSKVWLAHHHVLQDRRVAVKLLLSDNRETIDRFTREASITSRLQHDCIIKIFDHGFQSPYYYTVMEYVPGSSLRDLLKKQEPLPLELALHVFRCAGSALDYAHKHGVIHRDVSPGNILLQEGQARVLLTDFGIARETATPGITTMQHFMGTPGYLSPEQAMSPTAVTHLSDIYSLGIVLYEMLTGKLPWNHLPGIPGPKGGAFVPPLPLRERGVNYPAELERIISSLLAPEPNKRYPNARAAIEELDQVFQRHTSKTMLITPETSEANQRRTPGRRVPTTNTPVVMHPVERVLRGDLIKTPILDAQRLYEKLHDYDTMAELLNTWSNEGYFRQPLLGRMAHIHRITNNNIYFYTLRVLFETRDPVQTVEEPDLRDTTVPFEKEVDRWSVTIPIEPSFYNDIGGELPLPGSTRVISCPKCNGLGRIICPRCNGKQRIEATSVNRIQGKDNRAAALPTATGVASAIATSSANAKPLLVPCPDCSGMGGSRCQECATTGRLVQKKITTWHRYTNTFNDHDPMPRVDERWLHATCKAIEVYKERVTNGFREEWMMVPILEAQITKARQQLDQNTRVILSEVTITLIPANEVTFDLGDRPRPFAGFLRRKNDEAENVVDAYSSYIYGFEQKFANDWRFLDWWKVTAYFLGGMLLLVSLIFILHMLRHPV